MMYCRFCGQYLSDDSLYCKKCGKSVNEEYIPQVNEENEPQNNDLNYQYTDDYNYSISDVPAVVYEEGFFFKGISRTGRFWILTLGVLITMFTALFVFALFYADYLRDAISYISRMFI